MSRYHENITWPSADGTWSIGFFAVEPISFHASDDEDFDEEWDREFDTTSFMWVSRGHKTPEAAAEAWHGPNPGGGDLIDEYDDEARYYDKMAEEYFQRKKEERQKDVARGVMLM